MKTIYVTVERGLVHDVTSIPVGIEVVVIDYDVDLIYSRRAVSFQI